jgi:hypothetical protein
MNAPHSLAIVDAEPSTASAAIMMNPGHMQALMSFADAMARSKLTVPEHLQNKPADCMAIAMQAAQWGMNPFAVAQKTHIVSGRLGYEAQLVNAVVQNSGAIKGAFAYEYQGEGQDLRCRVGAVLRGESDITWGEWLRNGDVTTRNSPLWKTNVRQQLGYLQVKNWARLYAPGAILGVYTPDELEAVEPTPAPPAVRHMGAADEVRPALPAYPMPDFERNFPAWQKAVASGKKTAPDLLAMLSTKATFTEDQKAAILCLKAAPAPAPEPEPAVDPFLADMDAAEGVAQ